jgi:hypothetical protein
MIKNANNMTHLVLLVQKLHQVQADPVLDLVVVVFIIKVKSIPKSYFELFLVMLLNRDVILNQCSMVMEVSNNLN